MSITINNSLSTARNCWHSSANPNGDKPQRKMREAAASFKSDLKSGKKFEILDVFVLKLPDADSHRFHLTEGEVHWRLLLAVQL